MNAQRRRLGALSFRNGVASPAPSDQLPREYTHLSVSSEGVEEEEDEEEGGGPAGILPVISLAGSPSRTPVGISGGEGCGRGFSFPATKGVSSPRTGLVLGDAFVTIAGSCPRLPVRPKERRDSGEARAAPGRPPATAARRRSSVLRKARPHPEGGAFQANVPRRPSVHRDAVRPFRRPSHPRAMKPRKSSAHEVTVHPASNEDLLRAFFDALGAEQHHQSELRLAFERLVHESCVIRTSGTEKTKAQWWQYWELLSLSRATVRRFEVEQCAGDEVVYSAAIEVGQTNVLLRHSAQFRDGQMVVLSALALPPCPPAEPKGSKAWQHPLYASITSPTSP
eukprot:EG_transcript_3813